MIQVINLSKSYGRNLLFDRVNFVMNRQERLGLVGQNGHGKTTLFRLLVGNDVPDDGKIVVPNHYRIGHLSQSLDFREKTVLDEVCSALPQLEDGTDLTYRAKAALQGLGIATDVLQNSPSELSGGYQVRLNLAKLLVSEPGLMLLDEPTNHLDILSRRWLQRFLCGWRREMILITHDREFMDSVTTHTMAIHRHKLRKVEGKTEKVFLQIAQEEKTYENTRVSQERNRRQQEQFIQRFKSKSSKAKSVQSRVKILKKMPVFKRLKEIHNLSFFFRTAPFSARQILGVQKLSFHYPGQPFLFEDLIFRVGPRDRIAVIGPNGQGKTTLLSLLANLLEPVRGTIRLHPNTQIAYFGQSNVERLDPEKTVEEEILQVHPEHDRNATRGICGRMMFEGDDAFKKIKVLSGGEKSRVLLGKLLARPANFLLLDEPSNHLDMQATEGLITALENFEGAVVIVTHSEMILRRLANRLVVFDGGEVRMFEGSYLDFLDRIGWLEEKAEDVLPTLTDNRQRSRKELRRLRAEIIAERSKLIKPLETRIGTLEKAIIEREEELKQVNTSLCDAATQGSSESIATLDRRSRTLKTEIQEFFEELENLTTRYDAIQPQFKKRLKELE